MAATTQGDDRQRCGATTAAGAPCRNWAVEDGYCRIHARSRADAEARSGRSATSDDATTAGATTRAARRGGDDATAEPGRVNGTRGERSTPTMAAWKSTPNAARGAFRTPGFDTAAARGPSGIGADRADRSDRADRAGRPDPDRRSTGASHAPGGERPTGPGPGAGDIIDALGDVLGDGLAEHLAALGSFVRSRFTGDYEIDDFGLDPDLMDHVLLPLLRPLYDTWWRVTSSDREHIPDGGGLLVANHAGTLPFDGMMLGYDVRDATGRFVRELGANLVFETPFVGHLARKSGAVRASHADADEILGRGDLAAVFPEGFKGLGKPFSQRYHLERFGRGGFVATALRNQVPIVPVAIVGSEEIYPILWDARVVAKALGLPYFPIVAQMLALPMLGPIGLLPLPSKWSITYGEPIPTAHLGPDAAEDPMVVFDLADRVRDTIQQMLTTTVMGRRSVFF